MKKIAILLGALTIIVCVGRVIALVHTPLDVIGGILVAFTGIVWYLNNASRQKPKKSDN